MWKKLEPTNEERASTLVDMAFEKLKLERWRVAEGLSYFTMSDKQIPERYQLIGQLNYWQCIKWQGRYEEIRSQVEKADFSAKELRFQLALLAIASSADEFFGLLPRVIETHSLTLQELQTWPIFREMRADARFKEYRPSSPTPADATPADGTPGSSPEDPTRPET